MACILPWSSWSCGCLKFLSIHFDLCVDATGVVCHQLRLLGTDLHAYHEGSLSLTVLGSHTGDPFVKKIQVSYLVSWTQSVSRGYIRADENCIFHMTTTMKKKKMSFLHSTVPGEQFKALYSSSISSIYKQYHLKCPLKTTTTFIHMQKHVTE